MKNGLYVFVAYQRLVPLAKLIPTRSISTRIVAFRHKTTEYNENRQCTTEIVDVQQGLTKYDKNCTILLQNFLKC